MNTTLLPFPKKPPNLTNELATIIEVLAYATLTPAILGTVMSLYYLLKCCKNYNEYVSRTKCATRKTKSILTKSTLFASSAAISMVCLPLYFNQNKRNPSNIIFAAPMILSLTLCLSALIMECITECKKINCTKSKDNSSEPKSKGP